MEELSKLSKQIKMLQKRKWKKIYKHFYTVIPTQTTYCTQWLHTFIKINPPLT